MTKPKTRSDDDEHLGPHMRALTEIRRRFVQIYIERPTASVTAICRAAGYSTGGKSGVGIRTEAVRLLKNEKVLRAINEQLEKSFRGDAPIGRAVLLEIALDKEHPQRLRAAEALLGRAGFPLLTEQKISVTHTDLTSEGMIERIKQLALELGVDATKLIGHSNGHAAAEAPAITIEAEAVDADATSDLSAQASAPCVMRYVARAMVGEYEKAGWQAPHPPQNERDDRDMIEMIWPSESEPRLPDTRPMTS
jgi:hypothetical protein